MITIKFIDDGKGRYNSHEAYRIEKDLYNNEGFGATQQEAKERLLGFTREYIKQLQDFVKEHE